jgi:spermidine synthase
MNRWLAASIVFIEAMAVLVLEILSVRLLAPYVGLTLETTTSIIGAVLLGIAVGAGVGGWLADRVPSPQMIVVLFESGGILALLTVPIVRVLGPTAIEHGTTGALWVTFPALVPVAAVLSAISPTVAKWRLTYRHNNSGTIVGGLSGWATAGALIGTFGTGFVIVPLMSVSMAMIYVGVALILTGSLLAVYFELTDKFVVAGLVVAVGLACGVSIVTPSPCQAETTYHCVNVTAISGGGRYLFLDREANSYVNLNNPTDLGTFHYSRWIAGVIENYDPGRPIDMLVVGGGAFTFPRWLQATRPDSRSTTLEVDQKLITFDREHLGLHTNVNLRAIGGDARLTIRKQLTGSIDVVVGDAFSGLTVPWQLMTTQWAAEVKRVLVSGGFYAINMIDGKPLSLLRSELATLRTSFSRVELITKSSSSNGAPSGGNAIILASNTTLPISAQGSLVGEAVRYNQLATSRIEADPKVLTDDYAPVEQLQTR